MIKKIISSPIFFIIAGLLIALVPFLIVNFFNNTESQLKEAYTSYTAGENAKTLGERKDAFNRALTLYTSLEKENEPIYGDGKLYYNIGNTYYQLEEYPWAILYYYRALSLMPGNEKVLNNLKMALNKMKISQSLEPDIYEKIFFFHSTYSLPERLRFFFLFGVLSLVLLSAYIWRPLRILSALALFAGTISLIFFVSTIFTHYISPIEAVIVQPASLHRDAGDQYAEVKKEPVAAGTKVEVLAITSNGKWLKILTPDGILGYVSNAQIRLIQE